MPERDLAGRAHQKIEGECADNRDQGLVCDTRPEVCQDQRKGKGNAKTGDSPEPDKCRVQEARVGRVAGAQGARKVREEAHTRSNSSREPKMPHGRSHRATRSTRNGATSETWGAI